MLITPTARPARRLKEPALRAPRGMLRPHQRRPPSPPEDRGYGRPREGACPVFPDGRGRRGRAGGWVQSPVVPLAPRGADPGCRPCAHADPTPELGLAVTARDSTPQPQGPADAWWSPCTAVERGWGLGGSGGRGWGEGVGGTRGHCREHECGWGRGSARAKGLWSLWVWGRGMLIADFC